MSTYKTEPFGATDEYSITYPDTDRLYVFSPYYVEVSAQGEAIGTPIHLVIGGTTMATRMSGLDRKAKFPISSFLQGFFAGVDFGDVLPSDTGYPNTASKLLLRNKSIVFKVDDDTNTKTITYGLIWGALQLGEVETTTAAPEQVPLYIWDDGTWTLPITLTHNIGNSFGTDIWISEYIDDNPTAVNYGFLLGADVIRRYIFYKMPYCSGGTYVRWIAPQGEYKYYYFEPAFLGTDTKELSTIKNNIWSLDASDNGQIKSDVSTKAMKGNDYIECGVRNADYNQLMHLKTLEKAIKQWIYVNEVWIEVKKEMQPIIIDRYHSPQEISVKFIIPSLYLQSL